MRPVRHVTQLMAPGPVGGAEQVVMDLCRMLGGSGVRVSAILVLDRDGNRGAPPRWAEPPGVELFPLRPAPRRYLRERREIRELLGELEPDVVHSHGYRTDVVDSGVPRSLGIPTVTTAHGFTTGGWRNDLYQWLQVRAFRSFDAVVSVSKPLTQRLIEEGISPERVHTIPNARILSEPALSPTGAREALHAPGSAFHVGWIGRMGTEKGPDVMIEAIEILSRRGSIPELRVTLIGDGGMRQELEARTAPLIETGEVAWLGTVPDAARLLPGFDLIVMSSRSEGTPIVALEALGLGVPFVATSVGGIPDLVGADGGLLVPPEAPEALADAIESVHRNPSTARDRAKAGRRRVEEVASPERWVQSYLKVYRSLLESDRS